MLKQTQLEKKITKKKSKEKKLKKKIEKKNWKKKLEKKIEKKLEKKIGKKNWKKNWKKKLKKKIEKKKSKKKNQKKNSNEFWQNQIRKNAIDQHRELVYKRNHGIDNSNHGNDTLKNKEEQIIETRDKPQHLATQRLLSCLQYPDATKSSTKDLSLPPSNLKISWK